MPSVLVLSAGVASLAAILFYAAAGAQEVPRAPDGPNLTPELVQARKANASLAYSPAIRNANGDTNLYWGDTHLHTTDSPDAFTAGLTLTPDDAFRFARGEAIATNNGTPIKLRRPYDFLAVTDHAEFMGVYAPLMRRDPALASWAKFQTWGDYLRAHDYMALGKESLQAFYHPDKDAREPESFRRAVWQQVGATADRFNAPGKFTAFIGYEWTSMPPSGDNLHRVVLFRDDESKTDKIIPFSAQDSKDPEDLWKFLGRYEKLTGGSVLAIPHNANLSNGLMFAPKTLSGQPFTAAYARERSRWEPAFEVTQIKGTSEAHPTLSPTDEFANFEIWDHGNIVMSAPKQPWMLRYEYARSALEEGLKHEQKLGVNPFKFGMIGGTDSHTGFSSTAEDNFFGHGPDDGPSPTRAMKTVMRFPSGGEIPAWKLGASGMAGVWAKDNTREAIFDAIRRREVYATTGSRIQLRFFGGWNYRAGDVERPDYARIGYAKGVPMGGDLVRSQGAHAPTFMIAASKDPDEANLDRIQVIKGWVDSKGESHEKIYDVALSHGRKVDPRTGKAPPVGNTVDVTNATYTNTIGDPQLATVWTDPGFDPKERAFYYVRVLEIPKPRWTAYDAAFFKVKLPKEVPMTVQDRAFSSPIWYSPS